MPPQSTPSPDEFSQAKIVAAPLRRELTRAAMASDLVGFEAALKRVPEIADFVSETIVGTSRGKLTAVAGVLTKAQLIAFLAAIDPVPQLPASAAGVRVYRAPSEPRQETVIIPNPTEQQPATPTGWVSGGGFEFIPGEYAFDDWLTLERLTKRNADEFADLAMLPEDLRNMQLAKGGIQEVAAHPLRKFFRHCKIEGWAGCARKASVIKKAVSLFSAPNAQARISELNRLSASEGFNASLYVTACNWLNSEWLSATTGRELPSELAISAALPKFWRELPQSIFKSRATVVFSDSNNPFQRKGILTVAAVPMGEAFSLPCAHLFTPRISAIRSGLFVNYTSADGECDATCFIPFEGEIQSAIKNVTSGAPQSVTSFSILFGIHLLCAPADGIIDVPLVLRLRPWPELCKEMPLVARVLEPQVIETPDLFKPASLLFSYQANVLKWATCANGEKVPIDECIPYAITARAASSGNAVVHVSQALLQSLRKMVLPPDFDVLTATWPSDAVTFFLPEHTSVGSGWMTLARVRGGESFSLQWSGPADTCGPIVTCENEALLIEIKTDTLSGHLICSKEQGNETTVSVLEKDSSNISSEILTPIKLLAAFLYFPDLASGGELVRAATASAPVAVTATMLDLPYDDRLDGLRNALVDSIYSPQDESNPDKWQAGRLNIPTLGNATAPSIAWPSFL